jgi:hypothetical protein
MQKYSVKIFLFLLIFIPFSLWLAWVFSPKRKLVVAMIDKTVVNADAQEHLSLTWILKHQKFCKTSSKSYQINDYFGFFPLKNKLFKTKGLERFSDSQLNQLAKDSDLTYFTDTYGVYNQDWYSGKSQTERSGILYGGMSSQDVKFLKKMKQNHKLVMMEFNDINSPTSKNLRASFETEFGVHWTGWIGRYFDSFDTTTNAELPNWLIQNYIKQHKIWNFTKAGVAFVHENGQILILEKDTHLTSEVPFMIATEFGQNEFSLPENIKYSTWFDVLENNPAINKMVAYHEVFVNENGKKVLDLAKIPARFPAILMHKAVDYEFYYFAGNFSSNNVSLSSSYFKFAEYLVPIFAHDQEITDRKEFFWKVYYPLTSKILEDYYQKTTSQTSPK